jgi:hypothetical protein
VVPCRFEEAGAVQEARRDVMNVARFDKDFRAGLLAFFNGAGT